MKSLRNKKSPLVTAGKFHPAEIKHEKKKELPLTQNLIDLKCVAFVLREIFKQHKFYFLLKAQRSTYPSTGTDTIEGKKDQHGLKFYVKDENVDELMLKNLISVLDRENKIHDIFKEIKHEDVFERGMGWTKAPLKSLEQAVAQLTGYPKTSSRHRLYGVLMLLYAAEEQAILYPDKKPLLPFFLELIPRLLIPTAPEAHKVKADCLTCFSKILSGVSDYKVALTDTLTSMKVHEAKPLR